LVVQLLQQVPLQLEPLHSHFDLQLSQQLATALAFLAFGGHAQAAPLIHAVVTNAQASAMPITDSLGLDVAVITILILLASFRVVCVVAPILMTGATTWPWLTNSFARNNATAYARRSRGSSQVTH